MIMMLAGCLTSGCSHRKEVVYTLEETTETDVTEDGAKESANVRTSLDAEVDTDSAQGSAGEDSRVQICVYLCGAVQCPGVISLPQGSRVNDAVLAAGGLTPDAAAETINLAARLADEEMIYIPTREEVQENPEQWSGGWTLGSMSGSDATRSGTSQSGTSQSGASQPGEESALININTADQAALCRLPGIGESRAGDIITYRETNGAFSRKEDIMKVTGIKENLYEKLKELITVE